jgi:C4-dicarboxylate transporter
MFALIAPGAGAAHATFQMNLSQAHKAACTAYDLAEVIRELAACNDKGPATLLQETSYPLPPGMVCVV